MFEAAEIENPNVTLHNNTENFVPSQEVSEVINALEQHDTELMGKLMEVEAELPKSFTKLMSQDVSVLTGLVDEVKTGQYEIVKPYVDSKIATMSDYDRAIVMNNPNAFIGIYSSVKEELISKQTQTQERPAEEKPKPQTKKPKPNVAEVGVNHSSVERHKNSSLDEAKEIWDNPDFDAVKRKLKIT